MVPRTTITATFLVVCWCWCTNAVGFSSAASSSINAVWSDLNITSLNPATGVVDELLFASGGMGTAIGLSPALDHQAQRLFVPFRRDRSVMLGVFDLSVPDKATLLNTIAIPGDNPNVYSSQYDPITNTVWLVAGIPKGEWPYFLVMINLTSTAVNVTALPTGYVPAFDAGLGSPAVMEEENRELVLSVTQRISSDRMSYSLLKFNVDSQQFSVIPFSYLWPCAMVKDVQSGTVYALFKSGDDWRQPLSFGTVDTTSGKLEVINKWTTPSLLFVINSVCTFDPQSSQFYAIVGNGRADPSALVTVSTTSGELVNMAYFPTFTTPSGLFVV